MASIDLRYRPGPDVRALAVNEGHLMTTMYRIRATETDTGITRESVTIHPYEAAVAIAIRWAETYYGENGATWCMPRSEGVFLVGRLHDDGFREGGTCMISIELEEDAA